MSDRPPIPRTPARSCPALPRIRPTSDGKFHSDDALYDQVDSGDSFGRSQELSFDDLIFGSPSGAYAPEDAASSPSTSSVGGEELPLQYNVPLDTLSLKDSKVGVDDFDFLRLVGKGGYGKVYLVRKRDSGHCFAMKVLRKKFLVETNNVSYTKTERDILKLMRHPNIVSLHYAFQSEGKVYLVMDWISGGQLFFHLRREAMFSEEQVRFYAAEIVLAVEALHAHSIIHRDLKPENILLNHRGHVVVTDFGLAKMNLQPGEKTSTWCGSLEYMAPEILSGEGHGYAADWWSVGVLLYDMICGKPPFTASSDDALQKKIRGGKVRYPKYLSSDARFVIRDFLNKDPAKRLGAGVHGPRNIRTHRFFSKINWKKLAGGDVPPPFVPEVADETDVANFDEEFTAAPPTDSPCGPASLSLGKDERFLGFSWVRSCSPMESAIAGVPSSSSPLDSSSPS